MKSGGALATGLVLGLSAYAQAIPVDRVLRLEVGSLRFEKASFLAAARVEPASLATAEPLPSGEVLVTPLHPGDGFLYLYEEGRLEVVRLHVAPHNAPVPILDPAPLSLETAQHACRDVEMRTVDGETFLHATIDNAACREGLKTALAGDDLLLANQMRLTFTVSGLQAQLSAMRAKLAAGGINGIELSYAGATLTLKGRAEPAAHMQALAILWTEVLGRMSFDDQINLSADDGEPEPTHAAH